MNKIYTLLVFALLISVSTVDAQVPSIRAYQKSAKKAMEDKDYYGAMRYYQLALKKDSSRVYNMYNLGEAARLFKSFNIARDAYQLVLEKKSEETDYPLTDYWLADVFHQQAEYDSAIVYYEKFISRPILTSRGGPNTAPDQSIETFKTKATASIEDCRWAIERKSKPKTNYKVYPFGQKVNTPASEFAPVEHNNQVYYSGMVYDEEDYCPNPKTGFTRLYTSTSTKGGDASAISWLKEEKGKYVVHTAFNRDDTRMYFTVCNKINATEFDCDIYYRNKDSNNIWGDAIRLPDYVNADYANNSQPNVGFDEYSKKELLFFVSDRAEEAGGQNKDYDIYCSVIENNGQVGIPQKLSINTDEDDITPFYNEVNNTLYFSSKGYQGFGGFDIYQSTKTDSIYSDPSPMDFHLNTSYDDIYFSTDKEFENAYFASNRLGGNYAEEGLETCCHDIYKLEIIRVDLKVFTYNEEAERLFGERKEIAELDSCYVTLFDIATGEQIERKFNADSNYYYFPLDLDKEYQITGMRDGRWTDTLDFVKTTGVTKTTTITRHLDLNPNVELYTYTFDKSDFYLDKNTGDTIFTELTGCTFDFYNQETGELILTTERLDDNIFYRNRLLTLFGKNYRVVASKEGYTSDTAYYSTEGLYLPSTLRENLFLEPEIDYSLSVELYFDNAEPDSNTWKLVTTKSYEEAYKEYTNPLRIQKFMNEYSSGLGLTGEAALQAQEEMRLWFVDLKTPGTVANGMKRLRELAEALDRDVNDDDIFQLRLEGSASPRSPKKYNYNLSWRRVHSVQNYLSGYSGNLEKAIREGRLQLDLIARGDDPSKGKNIPYKYKDRMSIYGLAASKERKVKIYDFVKLQYPISVYFDEDSRSSATQSYNLHYDRFTSESRIQKYAFENGKNLSGEEKVFAEGLITSFFEKDVYEGLNHLEILAEYFEKDFKKSASSKYELEIEASGNLASNKVKSIENYFSRYNGGVLAQYIRSGNLTIKLTPVDQTPVDSNSSFSIESLEQRKVKVVGLTKMN